MKIAVTVTLKKNVLDPQGKVVEQTLKNMGMNKLKSLRQGKYFVIDLDINDEQKCLDEADNMCKKLLANLIIEDYKINIL